jgi:hypothetical protein
MDHQERVPEGDDSPDQDRSPDQDWPLSTEDRLESAPPHWSSWFMHLILRPRSFFQHIAVRSPAWLTVLAAWLYGIAGAMERMESRFLRSGSQGNQMEGFGGNWVLYWLMVILTGIIGGVFYYAIGGWWYRRRLRFCGALEPDPWLARQVYLCASMAYVVPYVAYVGWQTATYASPLAAWRGDDWGGFLVMIALFWSVFVSYRGVRTVFHVSPWRARIWFGLLPAAVYGLVLVAVAAAFLGGFLATPPDLVNTNRIDRAEFSLEYPGNWELDRTDEDFDPDRDFSIGPPMEDAIIRIWFPDEAMDSQECIDQGLRNLTDAYPGLTSTPIARWGKFEGAGHEGRMTIDGGDYAFVLFCSTERTRPFEILWIVDSRARNSLLPGVGLIRNSFELAE